MPGDAVLSCCGAVLLVGVGRMVSRKDTEDNVFGLMEEKKPEQHVELGELSNV